MTDARRNHEYRERLIVASGRSHAVGHGDDVRRKEAFETGELASLGRGDEAVEKPSLVDRTRRSPSAG